MDCMGSYLLSKVKGSMGSWNQASIMDGEENTRSKSMVNRKGPAGKWDHGGAKFQH